MFERPTVSAESVAPAEPAPWIEELDADGEPRLAFEDGARRCVVDLPLGWTRIGRSAAADLQLDDPTVSRRHALIVRTPNDEIRVLDDRSLNGVFVNGERTDWGAIADGDELEIGRYRLRLVGAGKATDSGTEAQQEIGRDTPIAV